MTGTRTAMIFPSIKKLLSNALILASEKKNQPLTLQNRNICKWQNTEGYIDGFAWGIVRSSSLPRIAPPRRATQADPWAAAALPPLSSSPAAKWAPCTPASSGTTSTAWTGNVQQRRVAMIGEHEAGAERRIRYHLVRSQVEWNGPVSGS